MRESIVALVLGVLVASPGHGSAQEATAEPPREAVGRYFGKPVDLWKTGTNLLPKPSSAATGEPAPPRMAVRENVWAQPIRTPDGTWMIYVPPKQVLDFLESPTEKTARAYLAWKAEQTAKFRDAMVLLAKMKPANGEPLEALSGKTPLKAAPQDTSFRITYFKKPSCPHCVSQDAILSEWLTRRTSGKVDVVQPGERPELWEAYQVRGTPTLVLEASGQSMKEVLVGLQSENALEASLAKLVTPRTDPASEPRKEPAR
jgi:glutaredoxin/Holliday junction resolvase